MVINLADKKIHITMEGAGWSVATLLGSSPPSLQTVTEAVGKIPKSDSALEYDETLVALTTEVLRRANPKLLGLFLPILCSAYCTNSDGRLDTKALQKIRDTAASLNSTPVCGLLFTRGDIVWTCRQCAKDPTCVQCDKCFKASDHKGHEVYFHRASGSGGCCDCGDAEAWAPEGFCTCHKGRGAAVVSTGSSFSINSNFLKGLRSVLRAITGFLASHVCITSRGFHEWSKNEYVMNEAWRSESLTIRLHNDDKHTYNNVTAALSACGFSSSVAAEMTASVDKDGERIVREGTAMQIRADWEHLYVQAGLLTSVVPSSVIALTANVCAAIDFLLSIETIKHDELTRAVAVELVRKISELSPSSSAVPPRYMNFPETILTASAQFPRQVPYMDSLADNPGINRDDLFRFQRPFDDMECSVLGLVVLASPFLAKSLQLKVTNIVLVYQHDALFKRCYSQVFTVLYPCLNVLFCRSIGTSDETIFGTSVQILTADSVVLQMSSEGVESRFYHESHPVFLAKMLVNTLRVTLLDMGCDPVNNRILSAPICFLDHHSLINRRLFRLFRDIEYICTNPQISLEYLRGNRDPGMVRDCSFIY